MRRDRDTVGDKKLWRLGAAEVLPRAVSEQGSARTWARWYFLQVIARRYPAVLRELRRTGTDEHVAVVGRRWRLPAWTMPYAVATARFLRERPRVQAVAWVDRDDLAGELLQESNAPEAPTYNPTHDTLTSYRQRVESYIDDCERRALADGTKQRRPRRDPRAFEWLVDHTVGGVSFATIWKNDPSIAARTTVQAACAELRKLLDDNHDQK